jgi:hypothetical protein
MPKKSKRDSSCLRQACDDGIAGTRLAADGNVGVVWCGGMVAGMSLKTKYDVSADFLAGRGVSRRVMFGRGVLFALLPIALGRYAHSLHSLFSLLKK